MRWTSSCTLAVVVAVAVAPARADLFRVGPGGTHATIQAAADAARATPGGDTIRVAAGTWTERVEIFDEPGLPVGVLRLSGGWRAPGYVERDADPAATVVTAAGAGRPLFVDCQGGDVVVEGFTFRDGRVDESDPRAQVGGGVLLGAWNGCELTLTRNAIVGNRAGEVIGSPAVGSAGAGLAASVFDGGSLVVSDNLVEGNELTSVDAALGGGASFSVGSDATVSITGNRFVANRVTAALHANASGVSIELYGSRGRADFSDNQVLDGVVEAPTAVVGAASFSASGGVGNRMTLRRNEFRRTAGGVGLASQVRLWASGDSEIATSDSLIAESTTQGGIALGVEAGGAIVATNLTVADNAGGRGVEAWVVDGGSVEVWSSISFGNGTHDSFGPGTARVAHFTADPRFAAPTRGDYHLRLDSPAIDAGLAGVPGGLGPADLDLGPRVRGVAVDAGAYEHRPASGPACEVRGFGPVPFVDRFAPVCACLRDDGLRTSRCGGFAVPVFFDAVIPPVPGPSGEVEVRLRPWELGGGDYQLAAQLLHASKVDPVEIVGPKSGRIHPGKELRVRLRYVPTGSTATLRLAMRYRLDGESEPRETWLDLRVDPDGQQP